MICASAESASISPLDRQKVRTEPGLRSSRLVPFTFTSPKRIAVAGRQRPVHVRSEHAAGESLGGVVGQS